MRDLLIVGAGPAGLAVSIAAVKHGLDHEILEKGVLVNSIFRFPHNMVFFTTPELLEIGGLPFVTPYDKPTRIEALRYYRRVVDSYRLPLCLGEEVLTIEAQGTPPLFRVLTKAPGGERERHTRTVVLATGYYDHPNHLGIPGEDRPHVSHYFIEAHAYYKKHVVVVGGKNSAAIAALELYRAGAFVTLIHRGAKLGDAVKYWIRPDIENRIKEGSINVHFLSRIVEIGERVVKVANEDREFELPADAVLLLTGYHPDLELLARAGVRVDEKSLKPACQEATLESNVPGLYIAGALVSGRETNRIFIENGRFHGETIARAIRERFSGEPVKS